MNNWPRDERVALEAFYGRHDLGDTGFPTAAWEEEHLTRIVPPYPMLYNGAAIKKIWCHKKVAESIERILTAIRDHYASISEVALRAAGFHLYDGMYNYRRQSGGHKLSTHAWGAGIDLNARDYPLRSRKRMPQAVIDIFAAEGWEYGGDWQRKDPMHFQAARTR